jgi:hypothetical protein
MICLDIVDLAVLKPYGLSLACIRTVSRKDVAYGLPWLCEA